MPSTEKPESIGARVAVVGSRDFPNPDVVKAFVRSLPTSTVVVSGGARGVDQWAEDAATEFGLQTKIIHADWDNLGRRAGPIRNAEIVGSADRLVAFWNGRSRGTLNTVVTARAAGLPILILDETGDEVDIETALAVAERNGAAAAWSKGTRTKA
jgi:predicted Rossmann fold nucleotide-binding protein DprA/Smf involved in DNA uptake